MKKNKVLTLLVTGANGQLGMCLREIAPTVPHKFIFTDVAELDITDGAAVARMLDEHRPDWVINCAAYTAVDKAESDAEMAQLLNAKAVEVLALATKKAFSGLLHISTDYVYRGDNPAMLEEDATPDPISVYGRTKMDGEVAARLNPEHIILRTSWLYSIYGNNFVKTMRRLGAEKQEVSVVSDQWGSPTSAHDLAKAIIVAVEKPKVGTYHFSNEGATNWALFAEEIMLHSALECRVNHITTADYPTPAARPMYTLMSKRKFSTTFGVVIPEWEYSLEEVITKLEKAKCHEEQ